MNQVRHVVFDLGGVLIEWDPDLPFRRLIPDRAERARFLAEVCSPSWNLEQDRGRSWSEAEDVLIAEHPRHEALIRAYRRHWHEMVPGVIEESAAVIEALLASGADVTALTNWASDTFAETAGRFPLLRRFRGITVSGQIGLVKPDAAIFDHHAATFGLDPARTLFFDDNPTNVDGARAAGWKAELFTDAAGLRSELARHGFGG